jgi:hypothetical protein
VSIPLAAAVTTLDNLLRDYFATPRKHRLKVFELAAFTGPNTSFGHTLLALKNR